MEAVKIKRIYDEPSDDDGYRVLVDRLWPRGISKKAVSLDEWNKEIIPTPELKKWFDHKEARFDKFAHLYHEELKEKEGALTELRKIAKNETLSLLYASKNPEINQAFVLKDVLLKGHFRK